MPEVKTEALDEKLAENFSEVTVETLVTFLSEMKAETLIDTLAARLTQFSRNVKRH